MAHIRKSILINAPIDKVFAFARDPNRWNAWFVGLSEPAEIKGKGEVGTTVKQNFTMAGLSFPMTIRVVDERVGPKDSYWRGEFQGPITGTQTCTSIAKGDKTEMVDEIEYTIPGKVLGKIADSLVVEKMQERGLEQTLDNLKLLCEAAVGAIVHA